ncbi:hypothetical protein [Sabulibacter ruber]|uniref:hypothetical protein n=1 Tax=Sabulibacter ruber TaxID=2811901 RepID=UPI001A95C6C9|nr:hypothetical protein [Sabulibacter ruber]
MNKELINKSIETERLRNEDYWKDKTSSIAGLFIFFALWVLAAIPLKYEEARVSGFTTWPLFIVLGTLFNYQLLRFLIEDDLQKVYTGLDAPTNQRAVSACLENLSWTIVEKNKNLIAAQISSVYGLLGQRMVVISSENYIYINVKHIGTGNGRFPSLFGLNRKRVSQLVSELKLQHPTSHKQQATADGLAVV